MTESGHGTIIPSFNNASKTGVIPSIASGLCGYCSWHGLCVDLGLTTSGADPYDIYVLPKPFQGHFNLSSCILTQLNRGNFPLSFGTKCTECFSVKTHCQLVL